MARQLWSDLAKTLFENLEDSIFKRSTEQLHLCQEHFFESFQSLQMFLNYKPEAFPDLLEILLLPLPTFRTRLHQKSRRINQFNQNDVKEQCEYSFLQLFLRYFQFFDENDEILGLLLQTFRSDPKFCQTLFDSVLESFPLWSQYWPHKILTTALSAFNANEATVLGAPFLQFLDEYAEIHLQKLYNTHLNSEISQFLVHLVETHPGQIPEATQKALISCVLKIMMLTENQKTTQIHSLPEGIDWAESNFKLIITWNLSFENAKILRALSERSRGGAEPALFRALGEAYLHEVRVSHSLQKGRKDLPVCANLTALLSYLCQLHYAHAPEDGTLGFVRKCVPFADDRERATILENACRRLKDLCFMNQFFLFSFNERNTNLYANFLQIISDPHRGVFDSVVLTLQLCLASGFCGGFLDQLSQKISAGLQSPEELTALVTLSELQFLLGLLTNQKPLIQSSFGTAELRENYALQFCVNFYQLYRESAKRALVYQNLTKFISLEESKFDQVLQKILVSPDSAQLRPPYQNRFFLQVFSSRFEYQNPLRELSLEHQAELGQFNQQETNDLPDPVLPEAVFQVFSNLQFNMMLMKCFFESQKTFDQSQTYSNIVLQLAIQAVQAFIADSEKQSHFDDVRFNALKPLITNLVLDEGVHQLIRESKLHPATQAHLISGLQSTRLAFQTLLQTIYN